MFDRVRLFAGGVLAAAVLSSSAAGALTLTQGGVTMQIDTMDRAALASARTMKDDFLAAHTVSNLHVETFGSHKAWDGTSGTSDPQHTAVGRFSAGGAAGSGKSVVNGGHATEVRSDNTMRWGRYNTDLLGGNWLDSNDNKAMKWEISGVGNFNTLAFFVLDAADVGGKFSIRVGDTRFTDLAGGKRLANGNIQFVRIALDTAVDRLKVVLHHDRTNDGFGVDGMIVGDMKPVPLPPAAFLLIGALAALGGLRRRRRAVA
jgi:hypothetical protein